MKHLHKAAFFAGLILLISACVTQRKKGETGWFGKRYHNLTAKYNGYFNANVLYQEATAKLTAQHQDNFNQILDVYPYSAVTAEEAKAVTPEMDNAVKKLSSVMALHRVSDWADDCYLLAGQALFLKQGYESAEETFRFALEEFNPNKPKLSKKQKAAKVKADKKAKEKKKKEVSKKKKKKKSSASKKKKSSSKKKGKTDPKADKPADIFDDKKADDDAPEDKKRSASGANPYESSVFKRRPAYPDLLLWMGRTLIERDKFEEAEFLFNQLESDPFFPESLEDDLATAQAHNWLSQKEYNRAVEPLERAIKLTKKKKNKARLAYILAQIHSKAGRNEAAVAAYEQVLRSNPVYDMAFGARLNMALDRFLTGKANEDETLTVLKKMLKDDKNLDYRDQIYFTMAQIDLKKGDKKLAIEHLRQSLAYSKTNKNQKAESYYALANLYLESEQFVSAKNYFDSTLLVMGSTDGRYKAVSVYAKNLQDVAAYLTTISINDSLRTIYHLSDADKRKLAERIKKDREKAAEAAQAAAAPKPGAAGPALRPGAPPATGFAKPSTFYFYNESGVKKGKKDFGKVWGIDRENVDNWRRSQRKDEGSSADPLAGGGNESGGALTDAEFNDLFAGIPKDAAQLAVLDSVTASTMFKLGKAYRDQLENNKRSAETLEKLQDQYASWLKRDELETWFYCYLAFTDLGNAAKSKEYLDKIVAKYPNSAYAKSLTDPNFKDLTGQRERELAAFYKETYRSFQAREYQKAADRCTEAERKFGSTNAMAPQFALLAAMCQGSIIGKNGYCASLKEVIAKYPDSEVKVRGTEIARLIGCDGFLALPDETGGKKGEDGKPGEEYTLENDKLHYFLLVLNGVDLKLDNVKNDVSDYNRQYHKLEQLRISNIFLGTDTDTPIIVIRKFDNREGAMKYFEEIKKATDFIKEKKVKAEFFAITQNNYRVMLGQKKLDEYRLFFEGNYVK